MKKLYALLVFSVCISASQAQVGFGTYYQLGISNMSQLKTSHGFGIDVFSSIKKTPYSVGLSYSMGVYGYNRQPLQFMTSDGTMLDTYINVTNAFHNVNVYQRYSLGSFSRVLFPFVDARLGWNFFRTNFSIEDPEDETNCEALESDVLHTDNNWSAYAGGGLDLKLNGLFNEENETTGNRGLFFTFTMGYALGGTVSYMNVDGTSQVTGPHNGTHQHDSEGNTKVTPYYSAFINTQTQVVHQHHTGYVYTSPVRMFQFNFGFSLKF